MPTLNGPIVPGTAGPYAILINGGASVANNPILNLTLNAQYDVTLEMKIDEVNTFPTAIWETYQTNKSYVLIDQTNNQKNIYVQFRVFQNSQYYLSEVFSVSIVLDTSAPILGSSSIIINSGASFTRSRDTQLLFNVSAAPTGMQLFNEIDYDPINFNSPFIPFQQHYNWRLSANNGLKTVYARFRDEIGNTTSFVSASIQLNTTIPQAPVITSPTSGSVINQRVINVSGTAEPGAIILVTVKPLG